MVGRGAIGFKMEAEDGRGDAEAEYFYAPLMHEDIPLALDDVFGILVSCDIIRANKEVEKLKRLKLGIDRQVCR
jgi:hypothetical protein